MCVLLYSPLRQFYQNAKLSMVIFLQFFECTVVVLLLRKCSRSNLRSASSATEHASQAFLDVTFKEGVRYWVGSRVYYVQKSIKFKK